MTLFLLLAAVLVALTLAMLLPPLLRPRAGTDASRAAINADIYRDELADLEHDFNEGGLSQADYEEGRRELSRRLLDDTRTRDGAGGSAQPARKSVWAIALLLPVAAALLYFTLGSLPALSPQNTQKPKITAQQVEEMVARLAARMEQNPDSDPQGWVMLARAYKAMGRYEESVRAFARIEALVNADAHLLSENAEALALATGGSLRGRPSELLARALELDPNFPDALLLAGTAAYERDDYAVAVGYWERLLKLLPADSEDAQSLRESIAKARQQEKKRAKP